MPGPLKREAERKKLDAGLGSDVPADTIQVLNAGTHSPREARPRVVRQMHTNRE